MSERKKIAVIIPVFNAGKTLEKALLSVIRQDFSNYELIVVDGGSSDNSVEILKRYNKWISKQISEPDSGVYDAMNKGIRMATAEWLYFLGADDVLADESVFSHFFAEANPFDGIDILYGSVVNLGIRNRLIPTLHTSSFGKKLFWKNTLHHQSAFYRSSLFESRPYNTRYLILGDYEFHLWCWMKGAKGLFVPRLVAKCQAIGLSKNFKWSLYKEELRLKRNHLPTMVYLANIPWVLFKYFVKKISSK